MNRNIKALLARFKEETGAALIFVLILLVLGSITLIPVMSFMATSLENGRKYEDSTNELYTSDAGVEDGLWRIKYDYMGAEYDPYDYYSVWDYETDEVNEHTANVTIRNVWFPCNYPAPAAEDARDIIESEKLVVVGTAGAIPGNPYSIKIDFTPDASDNLTVNSLGVWLPQGFEYVTDSCSLQDDGPFEVYCPDTITVADAPGGSTVVWEYTSTQPLFYEFPDVDPETRPMTLNFTFDYTPPADNPNLLPVAIAWVTTDMIAGEYGTNPNDVPVSWDTDTRFYEILSTSGDTTIQAFSSKCELRQMGDAMSGDYVAIGGSLLADDDNDTYGMREAWHTPSSFDLNTIPEDADVVAAYLYWAGWRYEDAKDLLMEDTCSNINTYWSYSSPTGWEEESNEYKCHYYGDGENSKLLTLTNDMDLSSYTPGSVLITFDYGSEVNAVLLAEGCENFDNWDNGGDWSPTGTSFQAHSDQGDSSPTRELTLKDGMANLSGYSQGDAYISWDRWEVSGNNLDNGDSLWYAFSSDNGSSWSPYTRVFRNDFSGTIHDEIEIPGTYLTNGFKVRLKFYGFDDYWDWDNLYLDNIEVSGLGTLSSEDGLDFAFSGDDGASWSIDNEVFRGDQGSFMREFLYIFPDEYTTSDFKLRFEVVGCEDSGEKVRIDNIKITNCPVDREVTFKIDGEQVYFNGSNPASGPYPVVASSSYVRLNELINPYGFSYACTRDVTTLVKAYVSEGDPGHYPGNALYTVDDIEANNGTDPWHTGDSHYSHAGWSLIIVYASPDTAGHYIYIRDDNFAFHGYDDPGISLDFDEDGTPGGDITNFVVPEPITDKYGVVIETVAAKLTCFITEGDDFPSWMTDTSSIEITGEQSELTKSLTNPECDIDDVWNGRSYPGTYEEGVDIDTFELLWADNILTPGDSVLHVDMYTDGDAWNLVYFIISVRSETTTGGTSHYVIYG
jgi:hypothetical protein